MGKLDLITEKNTPPDIENKANSINILQWGSFDEKKLAFERLLLAGINNEDLLKIVVEAMDCDNKKLSKQLLINPSEASTNKIGNAQENQTGTETATIIKMLTDKKLSEDSRVLFIKKIVSDIISGPDKESQLDKILKLVEKNIPEQLERTLKDIYIDVLAEK